MRTTDSSVPELKYLFRNKHIYKMKMDRRGHVDTDSGRRKTG